MKTPRSRWSGSSFRLRGEHGVHAAVQPRVHRCHCPECAVVGIAQDHRGGSRHDRGRQPQTGRREEQEELQSPWWRAPVRWEMAASSAPSQNERPSTCGRSLPKHSRGDCGGSGASDSGLVAAAPNPTGAVGLQEVVPGIKVVNLGGCPHNPSNTSATIVHYLTFKEMPAHDQHNRPLFACGMIIHDQCERRVHYDSGCFAQDWGDQGHQKGGVFCKMGCKRRQATFNCPSVRWDEGTSWLTKAGHGCLGSASRRFWDTRSPLSTVACPSSQPDRV